MEVLALARGGLSRLAMGASGRRGHRPPGERLRGALRVPLGEPRRDPVPVRLAPVRSTWPRRRSGRRSRRACPRRRAEKQPIRLLGHSMGGLVVRAMLATRPGRATWERMCKQPGARFIMLGTPNGGSHAIAAMLMGRDALVKKLALVDLTNDHKSLLATIAGFDGVLNLLPHAGTLDLYQPAGWQTLFTSRRPVRRAACSAGAWPRPSPRASPGALPATAALTRARRIRRSRRAEPARSVAHGVRRGRGRRDGGRRGRGHGGQGGTPGQGARLRVRRRPRAAGAPASPPGSAPSTWMPCTVTSRTRATAFPALLDLLGAGTTAKLATTPPQRRAAAGVTVELREPLADMIPDREELAVSALGGRRRRPPRRDARRRVHVAGRPRQPDQRHRLRCWSATTRTT